MAKNRNLKGITVEINGSTTGLQDALKDVNSKITQTQAFLRDVENLLKLDPSNIELLAQKQAYLSTQMENTKTKIDALKAAQEQAKAAMEAGTLGADKYEALCREVAATEIQLKKLEEASGGNQAWENSLKGLNTELGKTQEGLTKVDALLKVDPGNLDLASQKATLLANGIDTNNEKLQLLRDRLGEVEGELAKAEGDAEKTKALTEEYDRLTTEVIATEAAIKGMQEEAAKSGQLETKIAGLNSKLGESKEKLTAIDNALKLDPTNVDLLRQKQEALSDQVGLTKEKLEALKQASEQAQSQMESSDLGKDKYDALQREIVETEEELKNLITSSAEANTALVSLGEAGKSLSALGDSIAGVGSKITTAVTVPLAAIGTAAVKTTADFDEQMSKVSAISGATGEELDALREKAKEMGATTKFSASEAGEAFEYMAMAGWDSQEMIEGIGGIMSLAAASGESLATTSDIVTDALTAFGLSASDAGEFADILATASANANTNVALLGESFKYCAPVAGALGYSVEDVTAALGLMANAGIKGSAAGTALRTLMTNLASPTKSSSAALEELGVSLTDAEGNMLPLREVLVQLREGFQETGEISEEAAALISESSEEAAEEAGESIEELAEAREEALETEYETVKKSLDREYDALKDNLDKEYEAQKDSLDARTDELQDALDAQYDAQKKAYEKEYSELKKSLDNAYDAEKDRLDAEYDAAKEGYDAQYDALKDKLDKEYAARKKAYDEAYDELENALDAEYEAQKKAYDKAYDAVKDELDARYDAQQKAYDDEYDARKEALDASYESQKDAYDKEYDALKSAQEKELDALEDSQSEQCFWQSKIATFGKENCTFSKNYFLTSSHK